MECAYYFDILGGRHVECAYYFDILGGRHMDCAYYFDFGRLCQYRLFFSPKRYGPPFPVPLNRKIQVSSCACLVA
jgi:hypothetical protein